MVRSVILVSEESRVDATPGRYQFVEDCVRLFELFAKRSILSRQFSVAGLEALD
jgi:hypothetical protein